MAVVLHAEGSGGIVTHKADHIKAAWALPRLVRRKPCPGSPAERGLLCPPQGRRRAAKTRGRTGFDLNKNNGVAIAGNNIQLKPSVSPVTGQNAHALAGKQASGRGFAILPQGEVRGAFSGGRGLRAGGGKKALQHRLICRGGLPSGGVPATPRKLNLCSGQGPRRRRAAKWARVP